MLAFSPIYFGHGGVWHATMGVAVIKFLLHHNVYECLVQFEERAELRGGW